MPRLIFSDRQILVLPEKKLLRIKLAKDKSYGKPVNFNHVIELPVQLSLKCLDPHHTTHSPT